METQNIQTALQGAKTRRKAVMKTSFQNVCEVLASFKKRGISDSVASKLMSLYYAAHEDMLTDTYLYHEDLWPKLSKRTGFRSVEMMLQAVYDCRLFYFVTLADGKRGFYNKNFKCFNDAADNAYVKKLASELDCTVTEVTCGEAETATAAELRSSNDAYCSAICSCICTNVAKDNELLDSELAERDEAPTESDTEIDESDSVDPVDPQSSDESEAEAPAAEQTVVEEASTVMRMTVGAFEGTTWDQRVAQALAALARAEPRDGGVMRHLADDLVQALRRETACGEAEIKQVGSDLRGLLSDMWNGFRTRRLAPYVVQRGMHKEGRQRLDAIEAWLANSYKGGYLNHLIQGTLAEYADRMETLKRGLHTTHPYGPYEFWRTATERRYYNDPDNGEMEIPSDLPPRPSFGHVLSLDETRWVEM